jgi:N-acetylmuramoyl-L-alanine amidase
VTRLLPFLLALALVDAFVTVSLAGDPPLVALDVGHSVSNPGAISSRGEPEFKFNAALVETIQAKLKSNGFRVVQIGGDGKMGTLTERAAAVAATGSNILISVHHDSVQRQLLRRQSIDGSMREYTDAIAGFSLFVSRKNRQQSASLRCASDIGSFLRRAGLRPSTHHADLIPGESKEWADQDNGVYYYDDLAVLKAARSPALLLEAGVIVNPAEEESVQTPSVRDAIASAIVAGLGICGIGNQEISR